MEKQPEISGEGAGGAAVDHPVLFGEKLEGIEYRARTGAYGIVENEDGKLAVVRIPTGYFLIGGGIEPNEDPMEALEREFLEETGYRVSVGEYLGQAREYLFSEYFKRYIFATGHFYRVEMLEKISRPVEEDHELVLLPKEECAGLLKYRYQRWGVEKALGVEPAF